MPTGIDDVGSVGHDVDFEPFGSDVPFEPGIELAMIDELDPARRRLRRRLLKLRSILPWAAAEPTRRRAAQTARDAFTGESP